MERGTRLIVFDCDSTLCSIEGVDELARWRGEDVFRGVEEMTRRAMDGELAVEQVFRRRLDLIRPARADLEALGRCYLDTLAPGAAEAVSALQAQGWSCAIVSGGLEPPVRTLADALGISLVRAVPVYHDPEGNYLDFDEAYPTARSGGKPVCVRELKQELGAGLSALVGDGVSDLEARPEVDWFIGFGGFVDREKVRDGADHYLTRFQDLVPLLQRLS